MNKLAQQSPILIASTMFAGGLLADPPAASAGCVLAGTQLTCSGSDIAVDLPAGGSNTIKSILINNVTERIEATNGCTVDIYGTGPLLIDVDTATFGLESGGYGLTATVTSGPGGITIRNAGDVVSGPTHAALYGETRGGGAISITNDGALSGGERGIWARTSNGGGTAGSIAIETRGNISVADYGIHVDAPIATVDIMSGHVQGGDTGVYAGGGLTLRNWGTISGGHYAADAVSSQAVTIENRGTIDGTIRLGGGGAVDDIANHGVVKGDIELGPALCSSTT